MKDEYLEEIVIGALLHDIGKVVQRADEEPTRLRHQEFGKRWFDQLPDELRRYLGPSTGDYILRHHLLPRSDPKYKDLDASERGDLLLVSEADNLAAGERKEEPQEDLRGFVFDSRIPLYSIFSKIGEQGVFKAYPAFDLRRQRRELPFPLSPEGSSIDPLAAGSLEPIHYRKLLRSFEEGLQEGPTADRVQHLLNLLEASFSFVPSETAYKKGEPRSYPDVSLFDHLKVTAAVASCLYHFFRSKGKTPGELSQQELMDRNEARYLLVAGDFSGVQDFIYTVSYRAALKGLRARSFYLELLLEHMATKLLEDLDISRANLLFSGGGSFYLLAPNTPEATEKIEKRRRDFNRFLLSEHQGQLFFALCWVELNGDSFLGEGALPISKAWEEVRRRLDEQKARKFHDLLEESFFQPRRTAGTPCDVCQKITAELTSQRDPDTGEEFLICSSCSRFEKVGGELPRARFIEVSPEGGPSSLKIEDRAYRLLEKSSGAYTDYRWSINDYHQDAIPLWVGNYPRRSLDFSEVVKETVGLPSLGTFRADVDNLGTIFSQGLPAKIRTLARMTTLSRLFTLFFKRYINLIAEGDLPKDLTFRPTGHQNREMVVVYSGGDDLFITGAWNDVAEFAVELRRAFKRFVGENPAITLSGGMVMTPSKFPIYRMALLAGEAEERAKAHGDGSRKKDSAQLFGQVMFWDEWEEAIEKVLNPLLRMGEFSSGRFKPAFPRGLIYKILALSNRVEKEEGDPYMALPRLAHVLARSQPESQYRESWEDFVSKVISLRLEEQLQWLKLSKGVLSWIDYMTRGGDET